MEDLISKELLSEVLKDKTIGNVLTDVKVIESKIFGNIKENELAYYSAKKGWQRINIHELAHKCKEWAREESYYLKSELNSDNTIDPVCDVANCWVGQLVFDGEPKEIQVACFGGDTEPESIFKACQWILDNKG